MHSYRRGGSNQRYRSLLCIVGICMLSFLIWTTRLRPDYPRHSPPPAILENEVWLVDSRPTGLLQWASSVAMQPLLQFLLGVTPVIADVRGSLGPFRASTTQSGSKAQFTIPASADVGLNLLPNIYDASAPVAQDLCPGYTASHVKTSKTGLRARLSLSGDACDVYGTDVHDLDLLVEYQTDQRLHVNIVPSHLSKHNASWFVLRSDYISAPSQEKGSVKSSDLTFSWDHSKATGFGFNITRHGTAKVLFSTTETKLVYENQFIELVSSQPENYNLYGLGEVLHEHRLGNNFTRTIYAADVGDPLDRNLYGSHPFYLQTRYYETGSDGVQSLLTEADVQQSDGNITSSSNGVYFRNAHGMEVLLNPTNVTWRTLGGSVDLYFFSGPTQPEVTRQYLDVIGRPALQQYWTYGLHQSRWGYDSWKTTEEVVNAYEKASCPLEVIWNDIDYMRDYRDFENDPDNFGYEEGREFLERLHDGGRYYIPIVDAAIYIPNPDNESDAYQTFANGNETVSWLLNPDGSLYIGAVWPGYTVFPDWLKPSTEQWWIDEFKSYYSKLPIDGVWIDMNEISSFCVGSCGSGNLSLNPVHPPFSLPGEPGNVIYDYPEGFNLTNATEAASASAASSAQAAATSSEKPETSSTTKDYLTTKPSAGSRNINNPPYVINHVQDGADLAVHAVSPNATHHNGVAEYDVHNIYGHTILKSTYAAVLEMMPGKRPFIIGRSTFSGSGKYAGHWGGDNASKWFYMYFSIPQALSFSLFGIPMFGVDVCGFNGNSAEELCNRWMQLGAFFPFYRNHNTISTISQEAYMWSSVLDATKTALAIRFQLLQYLNTLFYQAHTHGDTVMRALAWEFPNDPSLAAADRQFFLGPAILVTPVLTQGSRTVDGVFPGLVEGTEVYYDWYNHSQIAIPSKKNTTIDAPLGHIPVYVRGGYILAMQQPAMTTRDARKSSWNILIAPGAEGKASGTLYLDDGESLVQQSTKFVSLTADLGTNTNTNTNTEDSSTRITLGVDITGDYAGLDTPLANVTVLGVHRPPADANVFVDGVNVGKTVYDEISRSLVVSGLESVLLERAWGGSFVLEMG